jgi:hypothetical protein
VGTPDVDYIPRRDVMGGGRQTTISSTRPHRRYPELNQRRSWCAGSGALNENRKVLTTAASHGPGDVDVNLSTRSDGRPKLG